MADTFSRRVLRVIVAQLSQAIGWHAIQSTPLELMTDILHRYLEEVGKLIHRYAEQFGHTQPNLDDVGLAFRDLGINLHELEEYIQNVDCVACSYDIPKFPIPRESHLNFLKPGSREVVTRPVHVHEHLPPMHPEMEEEDYIGKQAPLSVDTAASVGPTSPLASPKASVFKRPGDPISVENPAVKRARLILEEEGRPLREISSVMMTTSGFLSPAREGKLPESRTPLQPSDSRSNSPQPSSYPMVPPEVKGEKKYKKLPFKRPVEGVKKLDKENKKKEHKAKDVCKMEKVNPCDDSRVKKLVSMKELSKLKALKPGALKMMAHSSVPGPSTSAKPKSGTKVTAIKALPSASPKTAKAANQIKSLFSPATQRGNFASDKVKESSIVDGKLLAEPDKQKLNIFRKISKVKEDKSDKTERTDAFEMPLRDSRESSPGLVIDESEVNSRREARMAQIEDCIDAVIQRSIEITEAPSKEVNSTTRPEETPAIKTEPVDSTGQHADSDHNVYLFDDDLYPPGTPSTPKTPELPVSIIKGDKNSEVKDQKEKKKKREKSKSKRELKGKVKGSASPKKMKIDIIDIESTDCPKTPEGPDTTESTSGPVFPFFSHFQPAPGLIPPPIVHPLFQRFPLPIGKNLPHPAMPNLPMPPPLFMQPRIDDVPDVKPVVKPLQGPSAPVTPLFCEKIEKVEKAPLPSTSTQKEKSVEKKPKEHKKDKKDKDKTKKKKDRKEKVKNKDKEEKKKIKGEKKERDKEKVKEKKEKKEKKKDKERDEKLDAVPKITLKFGPASPRPPTPDATLRKLVIRPVLKKQSQGTEEETERVSCSSSAETSLKRDPSPELARISALITRPPRQKTSSKTSFLKQEHPADSFPTSSQTCLLPSASVSTPAVPALSPGSPLNVASGSGAGIAMPKVKKSLKPVSKLKPRDIVKKVGAETEPHKEPIAFYYDNEGKKVWFCPACGGQDDGSPMIGCDDCDAWYHWVCVGIQVPPDENEDWYCRVCIVKKQEHVVDKKKKSRKRKMMT